MLCRFSLLQETVPIPRRPCAFAEKALSHCAGALYIILIDGVGREFNQQRVHARLVPDARADSAWPEIALFCSDDHSAIAPSGSREI
jgi:hypothetical protein